MAKEYFASYYSYLDVMEQLDDAECGRLYRACLQYSKLGEIPNLDGNEKYVFPAIKSQIDRDNEKYTQKCDANRENVLRRYTNVDERIRSSTKSTNTKEKEKTKDKENNITADKPHTFIPPTVDEVTKYCTERGKGVDANKWFDFYTAKGWMVGRNKMKDWQAAVRTWEKNRGGESNRIQPANAADTAVSKWGNLGGTDCI